MPYYIEYFARPDGVPLEDFHSQVTSFYDDWAAAHPQDELVLMLGRTWRLGPRPAYMSILRLRDFGRFDEWKAELERRRADHGYRLRGAADPFMVVQMAGVYDDLGEEVL